MFNSCSVPKDVDDFEYLLISGLVALVKCTILRLVYVPLAQFRGD